MNHPRLGLKKLIPRRRELRQELTKAEQILWKHLKAKRFEGYKFRRQHGIGAYIADFCTPRQKLIIEIDGDIHAQPLQKAKDEERQKYLEAMGYQVLRYSNQEVYGSLELVLEDVYRVLEGRSK